MTESNEPNPMPEAAPPAGPEDRLCRLEENIAQLTEEIKMLRAADVKKKKEFLALKVLMYTGLGLILAGALYSNTLLNRVQTQALEEHFTGLRTELNLVLANMEQSLRGEMLKMNVAARETKLQEASLRLHGAAILLENADDPVLETLARIREEMGELTAAFDDYRRLERIPAPQQITPPPAGQ